MQHCQGTAVSANLLLVVGPGDREGRGAEAQMGKRHGLERWVCLEGMREMDNDI